MKRSGTIELLNSAWARLRKKRAVIAVGGVWIRSTFIAWTWTNCLMRSGHSRQIQISGRSGRWPKSAASTGMQFRNHGRVLLRRDCRRHNDPYSAHG